MDKNISLRQVIRFILALATTLAIAWLGNFNLWHAVAVIACFYWQQLAFRMIVPEKKANINRIQEPKPTFIKSGKFGPSHLRAMK